MDDFPKRPEVQVLLWLASPQAAIPLECGPTQWKGLLHDRGCFTERNGSFSNLFWERLNRTVLKWEGGRANIMQLLGSMNRDSGAFQPFLVRGSVDNQVVAAPAPS